MMKNLGGGGYVKKIGIAGFQSRRKLLGFKVSKPKSILGQKLLGTPRYRRKKEKMSLQI